MRFALTSLVLVLFFVVENAGANESGWTHSGSLFILTTPEGVAMPSGASERDFPLLVRLNADSLNFADANANGDDIRFSDADGKPLAYQIEEWDAGKKSACVWVKIPLIAGNSRQEIKLRWGNPQARSESSGSAVFGNFNGYASVWHMGQSPADEVGTLTCRDTGTTHVAGIVGNAVHFPGKKGIFGGDRIPNYPHAGEAHSTELWFRAEEANSTLMGWGNEGGGRGSKVRMQIRGPAHVHIDSDFSDVDAPEKLAMNEWIHVVHTYANGEGRIYIDGKLAGSAKTLLNIKSPSRLWIGGWYDNYDFVGDIDEVRVSSVARSADWVRLEYENQKPNQTLVGNVVKEGNAFSVSTKKLDLNEGKSTRIIAEAGGAQKVYWIVSRAGVETVAATDQLSFAVDAGRVSGDQSYSIRFKAVYPSEIKTIEMPVTIHEDIPDPAFTLKSPATWNGRDTIEVRPVFSNLDAMKAKSAAELKTVWTISGGAVIKEVAVDRLILKRSQFTGKITVQAAIDNGGAPAVVSATIDVAEPRKDAWVQPVAGEDETPVDNQFFARDDSGLGTVNFNGVLPEPADSVFVKVYADEKVSESQSQKLKPGGRYAFAIKLKPGLIHYTIEFGTDIGGMQKVIKTVSNIVCGDAYIIAGQSNAVADVKDNPETIEWLRSFGNMEGGNGKGWANAVRGSAQGDLGRVGYWGFDLGKALVEKYKIPICIINGAVGGTRVDQHQPNPANHADPQTIYGRLHARIVAAHLTHGVRALLWYQGENNQGANAPTGDEDWKSYQQYFIDLSAAWKLDYPNIQNYYVFQFWPNSCAMGGTHAGDMTGEVIRTLPLLYSNMRIMSVHGVVSPGSGKGNCHFAWQGYAAIARLITPVIERDQYGLVSPQAVTAPNLMRAHYANADGNELMLEFDQPMEWNDAAKALLYLDDAPAAIEAGKASGNTLALKLKSPSAARRVTYLKGRDWDGKQTELLYGTNKIAALTFCDVGIGR